MMKEIHKEQSGIADKILQLRTRGNFEFNTLFDLLSDRVSMGRITAF